MVKKAYMGWIVLCKQRKQRRSKKQGK